MSNNKPTIAIIDYGVGNISNLEKAIRLYCDNVIVTHDVREIESASALILPGVGSFKSGMDGLQKYNLISVIKNFAQTSKPILGICLGAQLLMTRGLEMGETSGMDLIPGEVKHFPIMDSSYRIPNIGWRKVMVQPKYQNDPLLQTLTDSPEMYFVHSYIITPTDEKNMLAKSTYGDFEFCSIVGAGYIYGTQFHPERSGTVGLQFLENFVRLVSVNT